MLADTSAAKLLSIAMLVSFCPIVSRLRIRISEAALAHDRDDEGRAERPVLGPFDERGEVVEECRLHLVLGRPRGLGGGGRGRPQERYEEGERHRAQGAYQRHRASP